MDKNLVQRIITGAVFLIVLIGGIVWSMWSFVILFFAISMLGLSEFYTLCKVGGTAPNRIIGLLLGFFGFAWMFIVAYEDPLRKIDNVFHVLAALLPFLVFLGCFLLFPFELFRQKEKPFVNIALTLLGPFYIVVPFALWIIVTMSYGIPSPITMFTEGNLHYPDYPYNWHPLLGFFFILWTSDTMAYVCGRLFGKHKLFERISPKKTWEGYIGGMLFSFGIAYVVSIFYKEISWPHWMVVAFLVTVFGTLGDLTESMFKRSIGVKDSGNILPGHGGILDRFDAVLLASPFVCLYLLYVTRW